MERSLMVLEELKRLIASHLNHDRWNSGISDDRLAEKIASVLARGGLGSTVSGNERELAPGH